jgi:ATP-dependent RNA helicase DeaD
VPKVTKAPPSKDKGKPKWAGKTAAGAPAAEKKKPKDHKPKRKPQV